MSAFPPRTPTVSTKLIFFIKNSSLMFFFTVSFPFTHQLISHFSQKSFTQFFLPKKKSLIKGDEKKQLQHHRLPTSKAPQRYFLTIWWQQTSPFKILAIWIYFPSHSISEKMSSQNFTWTLGVVLFSSLVTAPSHTRAPPRALHSV